MAEIVVEFINLTRGFVGLAGGRTIPITEYFDDSGDECEPDDAVCVVAGSDDFGWLSIEIVGEQVTVH